MPKQNGVQFKSARDIIADHKAKVQAETPAEDIVWPRHCATGRILVENEKGEVVRTDMFFSAVLNDDGAFDADTFSSLVIRDKPGGEFGNIFPILVKGSGSGKSPRAKPWIKDMIDAFTATGVLDIHKPKVENPAQAETPAEAELTSPAAMPT